MSNRIGQIKLKDFSTPTIAFADGMGDNVKKCSHQIHPDFKDAFAKLDVHFAILSGQMDVSEGDNINQFREQWADELDSIKCTGIKYGSGDVTLMGFRTLPSLKEIHITAPAQMFESDNYEYPFTEALKADSEEVAREANMYLDEGKSNSKQLDLGFDDDMDIKLSDEPEKATKKSKGGRKKATVTFSIGESYENLTNDQENNEG